MLDCQCGNIEPGRSYEKFEVNNYLKQAYTQVSDKGRRMAWLKLCLFS